MVAAGAVGVVAVGIEPEDDGRTGVEELATDDDLVARARKTVAGTDATGNAGGKGRKGKRQEVDGTRTHGHTPIEWSIVRQMVRA